MFANHVSPRHLAATAALGLTILAGASSAEAASSKLFSMVRTNGLPTTCAPNATARVFIKTLGFAEQLDIRVSGLPPHTALDLFALQVPNFPFGIGWYIGDLETDGTGSIKKTFINRFSRETFVVAIGTPTVTPKVHATDGLTNPVFKPVHTLHLGAWFNSSADAVRAGCPGATTPFNGEHTAGVQVLNTGTFPNNNGPLRSID